MLFLCVKSVGGANEGRMGGSMQAALLNGTRSEGDGDSGRQRRSALCQDNIRNTQESWRNGSAAPGFLSKMRC